MTFPLGMNDHKVLVCEEQRVNDVSNIVWYAAVALIIEDDFMEANED